MIQIVLRGLFVLMTAMVAGMYALRSFSDSAQKLLLSIGSAMLIAGLIVLADIFTPRKRLSSLSGAFFGLLVGMLAAYSLSFIIDYISTLFPVRSELMEGAKVFTGVVCVFAAISMILQTKDDFRFVIPYVEFAKQIRGNRPMLLDTSAIIDGRILDIGQTQIIQGLLIVPRFVLNEMQTIADSADKLKRARGRRGLDIVAKLQANPTLDISIEDAEAEGATVDQKLVSLAQDLHARIITTDFNLTKVAELRGVDVININTLAEAMRPVVLPGELLSVRVVKPGESPGQGVGYLEDGTMVVVENARPHIGHDIALTVTSSLQTAAGRMIFGKLASDNDPKQG
ncbi:PIN/TRAM domain-containing protein [Planctomycetales bacterium ZRK34]|nr:PIN/TRAM domain-containing protein [Planctomycetales bacterium ZRK34]